MSTGQNRGDGRMSVDDQNDLKQSSREELAERVRELEQEVERLHSNQQQVIIHGKLERLEDTIDAVQDELADVETLAQNALSVAQTEAQNQTNADSKKGATLKVVRRKLVKDAYRDSSSKSALTTTMAQDLTDSAIGDEPARGTVHDAFQELARNWDAFNYVPGEPGSHTQETKLKCNGSVLEPSLIRGVAEEVTNDALRKNLTTEASQGRGL